MSVRKKTQATKLDPRQYSTAQVAASEGRLRTDHPLWRLDGSDEGEKRQELIRNTQQRLLPYLTPGEPTVLSALIQRVTGQPITDSMHGDAWQIRRAVFAWVEERRAEWVGGSLDRFRYLPPPAGALVSRPVTVPSPIQRRGIFGGCKCGAKWDGASICHCATCHMTFGSVTGFDDHRDRKQGRCRTPDELRDRGMEPNEAGHWRKPRPPETLPTRP